MPSYNITISNITGSTTPCNTYNIYTGLTIDFPESILFSGATIDPVSGYTFVMQYDGESEALFVFVEHCDGHSIPIDDLSCCGEPEKNQGGYQVRMVKLYCEPTPTPTLTPTVTPTVTPTESIPCFDCPTGYTWTSIGSGVCTSIDVISATPPTSPYTAYERKYFEYSMSGTTVYQPGWNVNGTGTEQIHLNTADVWKNTTGYYSYNNSHPGNGPLNRTGLWANLDTADDVDYPLDTWLGFNYCLTGITGGQYYIGIGADNEFRLEIDGVTILDTYANSGLDEIAKFREWHVYPITLNAGDHIIGLYGYNLIGTGINPAGFGCEIYQNSLTELTTANVLTDLNIIFTSTDFIGEIIPVIKDVNGNYLSAGYSCASGYEYAQCDGNCWKVIYCPEQN